MPSPQRRLNGPKRQSLKVERRVAPGALTLPNARERTRPRPGRFSWIGRACSICFRNSFVLRSLRASYRPAPRSLLGLQKHLLRNHFPPN
jgi:hypothetical protein